MSMERSRKNDRKQKPVMNHDDPINVEKIEEKADNMSITKKRFDGVSKGNAPNAATAYINSVLNVNNAKKDLKRFISHILGLNYGTINAQYPYTAIVELFVLELVRSTAIFNKKNAKRADLYEITNENIRRGVVESGNFSEYIKMLAVTFNPTAMDYTNGFFDSDRKLIELIEKRAFESKTNFSLSNDAINMICYLVNHQMSQLTRTACEMSAFGRKSNIGIRNYIHAVNIHFSGQLLALLQKRLSEIESLFTNKKESSLDNKQNDIVDDANGSDDESDAVDNNLSDGEEEEDEVNMPQINGKKNDRVSVKKMNR